LLTVPAVSYQAVQFALLVHHQVQIQLFVSVALRVGSQMLLVWLNAARVPMVTGQILLARRVTLLIVQASVFLEYREIVAVLLDMLD
jgi:hypothetical protein